MSERTERQFTAVSTLLLVQMLLIAARGWAREEDSPTTVIIQETRTEMSVEEIGGISDREDKDYFDYFGSPNEADSNLDFDYEDEGGQVPEAGNPAHSKELMMKEAMLKAMKKPAIRAQIGEVIPILRVMSPAQRLTLAALVSSQIMSQGRLSEANLTEMASMFAGTQGSSADERQNITEHLLLPISVDIAKIFKELSKDAGRSLREELSEPRRVPWKPKYHARRQANRRMDDFEAENERRRSNGTLNGTSKAVNSSSESKDCEYFSSSFCLEVPDYPLDAIIKSVEKNREIRDTLLEDFRIPLPESEETPPPQRPRMRRQDYAVNEIQDSPPDKDYMCASIVKYARPKRARTTSGQWKYIVNAGDYTQTLRLEMCLKPLAPCSYITDNFQSQCKQVYNYHRLLTWEENKGLHMDIFKVPSCCSCHIQGYTTLYPPAKDFVHAERKELNPLRKQFGPQSTFGVPVYANPAGKREAIRPIPLVPTTTQRNIITLVPRVTSSLVEQYTPLHHLIPSGPPLPLEGEGIQFRNEASYRKRASENKRRISQLPVQKLEVAESTNPEVYSSFPNLVPGSRVTQNVPNIAYPERNQVFTSPTRIRFSSRYPTTEQSLFSRTKTVSAISPSENPLYHYEVFEPTKLRVLPTATSTSTTTTTEANPILHFRQTGYKQERTGADGKKRINYSYHPIIEFFTADHSNSTTERYSEPFYAALSAQDWKPMIGSGF